MSSAIPTIIFPLKRKDWPKQIAIWLSITLLLPLTAWYATAAFHSPPDEDAFQQAMVRYSDDQTPKEQPAKDKFFAEKARLQKEHEDAGKAFYRVMFWVTYPVGLLAVLGGLLVPIQSIGAGFMFGGICSLSAGCYSAWDVIGKWAHFWSLIIALICIVVLGFWRLNRATNETPPAG